MMNGIVIRYVCLLILSLLLQTWNYLIRLSQELQLASVLPRRFMDVGELLPIATPSKNGLVDKEMAPSSVENGVLKVNLISEYGTPTFLISIYSAASIGIFLLAAQTYNQKLGGKCVCIGKNNLSIYVDTKNIYIEPHEHSNMNVCIIPLSDHSGVESVEKMEFEDLDAIKDKLTKIVPIALG